MSIRPRSSWPSLALGMALLGMSVTAPPLLAAEAPASVPVELAALGPDGLGGLALLAAAEGGSSVQLLVVGAPPGTTAVVHAGDCAAIDPAPVGLLGDLADGQLQADLPLPLEAIADGGHVIVLHPGLDLATALGCGPIPALAMAAAASAAPLPPASAAPVAGGSYTGPNFGFTIAWDGSWTQGPPESLDVVADRVTLTNGSIALIVGAASAFDGDVVECVRSWEQGMLDLAISGQLQDFTKLVVPQAPPPSGPAAAYRFTVTGEDGSTRERVSHYECRSLGAGAIVELILESDAPDYESALALSAPVVDSLTLPASPPLLPGPDPVPSTVPVPAPSAGPSAVGAFRDPSGAFSLAWPPPWEQLPVEDVALFLTSGASGVSFNLMPSLGTEECIAVWRAAYIDALAQAGQILEPQVFEAEQRQAGAAAGDQPALISTSYRYKDAALEGQPTSVSWAECRTIPGGSLAIYHTAREDRYATESQARQALLAGLAIPASDAVPAPAPVAPGPASSTAPAPEPAPVAEASAAAPVIDPGCAGIPEWAEATIARFDRIEELRIEAREIGSYELISFIASFGGQVAGMAARQEAGAVPALAAEANAAAIAAFGILEESADLQYEGLSRGGGAGRSGSLSEGQRRFDEGMDAVNEVRKEAERLIAMCTPEG